MALSTLGILLIVGGIFGFGLLIFLFVYFSKKLGYLNEIPADATIILNLKPNAAGGHAVGLRASKAEVKVDSREGFQFFPLDYDPLAESATKPFPMVVNKNKVMRFAKGEWSDYRNFEIVLPNSIADLPERFVNTSLGKALFQVVDDQNLIDEIRKNVELANRSKAEIIESIQDSRYLELYLEKQKAVLAEAIASNIVEQKPT